MAENKSSKVEREYVIPLREKSRNVPRYRKTPKAVKTIKEFLVKHMKIYDRDLNKIKIDRYLNEYLWFRGIKKHPHKIKVKVVKENGIVKVELIELPGKLKFKKLREEKIEAKAQESEKKKEKVTEEQGKVGDEKKEKETQEKTKSNKEDLTKLEKEKSKEIKHSSGGKTKHKTQPVMKKMGK